MVLAGEELQEGWLGQGARRRQFPPQPPTAGAELFAFEEPRNCLEVQEEGVLEGGRKPREHPGVEAVAWGVSRVCVPTLGDTPHRFGEGSGDGGDRPEGKGLSWGHSICPGEGAEGRRVAGRCPFPSLPHNV